MKHLHILKKYFFFFLLFGLTLNAYAQKPKAERPKQIEQPVKSIVPREKSNLQPQSKIQSQPKEADGDLQEKLAKLKGMFK